jgi:alpha-N-acetylglucosaminidase
MKKILFLAALVTLTIINAASAANPVTSLLERIDPGASEKFEIELVPSENEGTDFFELDQNRRKVVVRGNNYVSIATGINWYLKYHAGIHLSWNGMTAKLPKRLPAVKHPERHETRHTLRYYLNYCTFSYSMAFWDWERWQREIDWMAMHGINVSLAIVGAETVWRDILLESGYTKEEINRFVAGSGFLAWWQMNNLEGWGGPNPDSWYDGQQQLQKKIVARMREYGIEPALPGYAGMVPHTFAEKSGVETTDPGLWNNFPRPAFLQPSNKEFGRIADLYYSKLTELYGTAKYYAIDPFHEGGSTKGVDLDLAGKAIMSAMKKANPDAVWVAQAWQSNPRPEMIGNMAKGDLLVLDLFSESRPMWGMEWSSWYRAEGYGHHNWIYCMLLNFGGRTGLHGKMNPVIDYYYDAKAHRSGETLQGVGATMEAIENNPVMYELLFELPWRPERFSATEWLNGYVGARYGSRTPELTRAWDILSKTVYNCPPQSTQEGTTESVFAANPSLDIRRVSCCSMVRPFYNTDSVRLAAEEMLAVAEKYRGNNNFEYDLVDVVRQTVANRAYYLQLDIAAAFRAGDKAKLETLGNKFLDLMLAQDRLLDTRPEFMLGTWTGQARKIGATTAEKDLYEWNARTQITVWGNRQSAGGLHNYAYKEWSGVLRDVYYPRWEAFLRELTLALDEGRQPRRPDYYGMDEQWTRRTNPYPSAPSGDAIRTAAEVYETMVKTTTYQ